MRTQGIVFSGQVLLRLMEQGLSRTQAYEMVQRLALQVSQDGRDFREALMADPAIRRRLPDKVLRACVDPDRHLRHVERIFQRVGLG